MTLSLMRGRRWAFNPMPIVSLVLALALLLILPGQAADISSVYDDADRLCAVIDPASDTAIDPYDAVGNLTGITPGKPRPPSLCCSSLRATGPSEPASPSTARGSVRLRPLADSPNAVTTTFTYDPTFSQIATVTDPLSHTTTFGYHSMGNLTSITNALNKTTTLAVNGQGQPLAIKDPLNNITTFT